MKERLNFILEKTFLLFRVIKFRRKICAIRLKDKSLFKKTEGKVESQHKKLWGTLYPCVNNSWLRFYSNVSGISDPQYVPEDIYYSIIERRLNDTNFSRSVEDKGEYECKYGNNLFPVNFLKNVSGSYVDFTNKIVSFKEASKTFAFLGEDVVIKPSLDSGGGKNVLYLSFSKPFFVDKTGRKYDLNKVERIYASNFVVQKVIRQNVFFSQFNETSLNTLRVFTYRSILNEEIKILNVVLRMGRKGMHVDNQMAGGISVGVDIKTGRLNKFAVSKYGEKIEMHPDSKVVFDGLKIQNFEKILRVPKEIAVQIPSCRTLSFDVCLDNKGRVRLVEINTVGVEINFLQLQGKSLFGEYTKEIIDYCSSKDSESFDYLRITK